MEIPPDIKIPLCIEQGSVFNFYIDFNDFRRESKNRFFVVLNKNPKSDAVLIMLSPTTKIKKTETLIKNWKIDLKTIVKIKIGECSIFKKDCVFNCNNIHEIKIGDLIIKIKENGEMNYQKIPESIIKHLIIGVKESPLIVSETKGLL